MENLDVNLDFTELETASNDVNTLKDSINSLNSLVKEIQEKLDKRIVDKYQDYFTKLNADTALLTGDAESLSSFKNWLDSQISAAKATNAQNIQDIQDEPEPGGDSGVDDTPAGQEEASDLEETPVDPEVDEPIPGTNVEPTNLNPTNVDPGVSGVAAGAGGAIAGLAEEPEPSNKEFEEGEHKYITQPTTALEEYPITKEDLSDLSEDDLKTIEEKLKLVGYTGDEIKDFQEGNMKLPKVVVSNVATALEDTLQSHSELRDKLKERYGFDLFYEDGTINPTKLASALVIDAKNSNDGYDLIKMLSNDYNTDLIGLGNMTQFANKINDALELNPGLKNQLVEKYGFDIFNPDGTVNEDKLRYALMIDGFDSVDDLDMVGTLYGSYGIDVNSLSSLDTLSMKLLDQLEQNPQLRQQLMDKYGFDIFNQDGSVNMDRLRYALMLDTFDKNDQLDFLNILYGNEAGNLPDGLLDNLSIQLLSGLELDPEMRGRLIDMYGFDILNEDGTINLERLKYALMIDGIDPEDDLDLSKYLGNYLGQFVNEVTNTEDTLTTRKKGNPIPIIAGIGLAAAAGGAGYTMYKKQKEEEEASDEDKLYEDEDADFEDEIDI